jgi:ribose 5-phosphate isomerase B
MRIAIGADHRGREVLSRVRDALDTGEHEIELMGANKAETCDYPDIAYLIGSAVREGRADRGILFCGSGVGMSIAANKIPGVRAALVHDEVGAEMSRRHNDTNVLCIPADLLGLRIIDHIVKMWLRTEFDGGRHARRVRKIDVIEQGGNPMTADDSEAVSQQSS